MYIKIKIFEIQVKSVSINHDATLLLTGTSKSKLSIFDMRHPGAAKEVNVSMSYLIAPDI